jgi:hypothetical protein
VLVFILCVVHAQIRREQEPAAAETMSASQLLAALRIAREVEQTAQGQKEGLGGRSEVAPALSDENITTLPTARAKKD